MYSVNYAAAFVFVENNSSCISMEKISTSQMLCHCLVSQPTLGVPGSGRRLCAVASRWCYSPRPGFLLRSRQRGELQSILGISK